MVRLLFAHGHSNTSDVNLNGIHVTWDAKSLWAGHR